ncbi:hypothetical protein [Campylobacter ureolyticus]|uniref:Uncharacterized protein n=1 Tax=Campylobacter ureolyticus TaxID=827 RepID=A0A9Q4KG88_9BACT|nr:hypothetical protein [Campylobacter ureolyticus]MCZ6111317.1 hypothetical protein [Campylobacter ureolyticus]MCZ6159661.1 hypothetical protein [Campylobacter ureolyticus]MCZ6163435.1 hypothetical protein [Campylobacter ureolyticus]
MIEPEGYNFHYIRSIEEHTGFWLVLGVLQTTGKNDIYWFTIFEGYEHLWFKEMDDRFNNGKDGLNFFIQWEIDGELRTIPIGKLYKQEMYGAPFIKPYCIFDN